MGLILIGALTSFGMIAFTSVKPSPVEWSKRFVLSLLVVAMIVGVVSLMGSDG
ncbi:hypothetical protein ACCS54_19140 [Rhizobium johnstonii]|uniref:hypothetical protein n=1 Tax=Rhizobium TaxID=379 RepID=UPI00140FDEF0|nr:hypothetical protein [Rhizobium leguminosarum]QIO64019.1 hypothetical protein HA462_02665 [Rhizobium leguminosarum bv. trifolii]